MPTTYLDKWTMKMKWIPAIILLIITPAWVPFAFNAPNVYIMEYMMFGLLILLIISFWWAVKN
jgi:hypothetical protein